MHTKKGKARFLMIRHGQSQSNANPHLNDHDTDLTEKGIAQITTVASRLAHEPVTHVYSSHLKRAQHTGRILNAHHNVPHTVNSKLRERDFGSIFEATDPKQALTELFAKEAALPDLARWEFKFAPDTESLAQALNRIHGELLLLAPRHLDETVLVVSHGNLMRILLIHHKLVKYEDAPPNSMSNGGVVEVVSDGKTIEVVSFDPLLVVPKK